MSFTGRGGASSPRRQCPEHGCSSASASQEPTTARPWQEEYGLRYAFPVKYAGQFVGIITLDDLERGSKITIARELTPVPASMIDPEQMQKVLTNFVLNANDAVAGKGTIMVSTATHEEHLELAVTDTGCGISQEFIEKSLFRPFQSTKKKGLGIGLFHCKTIVEAHQGSIVVESQEGQGSTFKVMLPIKKPATNYTNYTKKARLILVLVYGLVCIRGFAQNIPESERQALVALYNATDGAHWKTNTNWMGAAGTENKWYGITVADGHITAIRLDDNKLNGRIPPDLGNLAKLESLQLGSNQLSGAIPGSITGLSALNELDLSGNQLSGAIPGGLEKLAKLYSLALDDNQLSGDLPPQIGQLTKLYSFSAAHNRFTGSIPPQIGSLANLTRLLLGQNQLSGSIPAEIGNLTNLEVLGLENNALQQSKRMVFTRVFEGSDAYRGQAVKTYLSIANPNDSATDLYSAQIAHVPSTFYTSLKLFNAGDSARTATLTAINEKGENLSAPVSVDIPTGRAVEKDINDVFNFNAGSQFVGSLKVTSDGAGIVGDVIFGDPASQAYAASLSLQTQKFNEAVFSQVVNQDRLYTGLALFNPGTATSDVQVLVYSAAGEKTGEASLKLAAGARLSKVLTELVPSTAGQVKGYTLIRSSLPIFAQQVFSDSSYVLSAIPPTVIR